MQIQDLSTEPFPLYYDFELSESKIRKLNKLVKYKKLEFVKSHVHKIDTRENIVNDEMRQSEKATIKNSIVYDYIEENIIPKLNKKFKQNKFHLVHDELEIVKYKSGDFFFCTSRFCKIQM